MRSSLMAVLLFASFVTPVSLAGQASVSAAAPATSDPQAVALVQHALAAVVGRAAVSDATLTGTVQRIAGSDDETGTATVTAMAAGNSKLSLSLQAGPNGEVRTASGGVAAGVWSGTDGVSHAMVEHNLMTDPTWFFPAFTLANIASSQAFVLSYIGPETHDGFSVVHVSVSQTFPSTFGQTGLLLQHLSQMDLYLDPSTLLPAVLAFNIHPDSNALLDIPTEIRFSSYQAVNGIQVPFHVQKYLNGGLILNLQFSNATLNTGLTAASFQLQ
jgi:hypothetical protein